MASQKIAEPKNKTKPENDLHLKRSKFRTKNHDIYSYNYYNITLLVRLIVFENLRSYAERNESKKVNCCDIKNVF